MSTSKTEENTQTNNETKIDSKKIEKKKKEEKEKNKRCCICRKKDWTNMKCECGEMCLYFFHLKRELHQCKIEHVIANKDYMMKASAAPVKVNVI